MNETENQKPTQYTLCKPKGNILGPTILHREMLKLKHGCSHDVWVQKDISYDGEVLATIDPVVRIANDDDPFYVQTFATRDELESFISELRKAADEAWGEK